jgi:predicted nucleic acid-binding protein
MGVIVDTIIWSLALRRNTPEINAAVVQQLRSLIAAQQVILLGAVRQEILSGLRTPEQFERLRGILQAFPNLDWVAEDYELAAEFFNTCRRNGIQGSNTDFLICAVAHRRQHVIFTTDHDFRNFQAHLPIGLFEQ